MNWEMINFLFRWDSSDFLLTYLSLPGGKACGCHQAWHPSQISCLPRALVPARLLVLGSRVPFRRPGLGLLSWPRWWVAMTCASSSVSTAGSICSLRPHSRLSWAKLFVCPLAISFQTRFCSLLSSHPPGAPVLKHRACPLCLVGNAGEYVWLTRAWNGRHGLPALPPHPGGF